MRWCAANRGDLGLRCAQYLVRTTKYCEYVEWRSVSVSVHQPGHQWGHCSVRVSFVDSFISSRDSAFAKSSRSGLTAPTCIPRWDVSLVRALIATSAGFSESPRYGDSIPLNQSQPCAIKHAHHRGFLIAQGTFTLTRRFRDGQPADGSRTLAAPC